ncbi:MAG: carboxypeptidase regulatory-like domain-containing protein [Nitrospirae bacterium]|nr:carboxypeptidase regulatory-like domain-containing protein [Nitrospirota bacterium]
MKLKLYLTSVLLVIFFSPLISLSAVVEGVVLSENGLIEDAKVYASASFNDLRGASARVSEAGEKKGFYKIELPPGTYYMTASGKSDGKDHFSYHGANPVRIEENDLWIPFMAVSETAAKKTEASPSGLAGRVTFKGSPVRGAQVSIYPLPGNSGPWAAAPVFKGMGYLTGTTDEDGTFKMGPEPGDYVIIARKRMNGGLRPLEKGDLFCYFAANPVTITDAKGVWTDIPCYPKDDLKAFLGEKAYSAVLVKKSTADGVRFRENRPEETGDVNRVQGRVTDLQGAPVKDIYVMMYRARPNEMFQMHFIRTMPDHMVRTDDSGHYLIDNAGSGTYYVVARERIGEAPVRGENYGLYEGNANHLVAVEEGPLKDVNIAVSRVMGEKVEGQGARGKGQAAEPVRNHIYSGDVVIDKDTVWEGEIIIDGTVHVARAATLAISPGTTVKFRKKDRNGDGVGDAMITVSGRLAAEGAPGRAITFTSGEERPETMDWSYILLFASGEESVIRRCVFEYAFTGVQAHFSKAVISDSVFTKNQEGIRFGRAELLVDHNDISGNQYGIRHTRVEEPVEIKYNNIRNNSVGIFLAPSNQNVTDFSFTFDKKETVAGRQFIVMSNNIQSNTDYNYRLGERQGYDILLNDNWWGSADDGDIIDTIYDAREDDSLGSVIYKPYFVAPAKGAGIRERG